MFVLTRAYPGHVTCETNHCIREVTQGSKAEPSANGIINTHHGQEDPSLLSLKKSCESTGINRVPARNGLQAGCMCNVYYLYPEFLLTEILRGIFPDFSRKFCSLECEAFVIF